jgi:SAM-dependent methyltransferase
MNRRTKEPIADNKLRRREEAWSDILVDLSKPSILDVGCGLNKIPGSVGMDKNPRTDADIIHDLNDIPYPVASNSFDVIYCRHVMEHLHDIGSVMEELHRIGKPDAVLKINVPFFRSRWAFTDPDHRRFFTSLSFDYFVRGKELSSYLCTDKWFDLENVDYRITMSYRRFSRFREALDRLFLGFVNKRKMFYEAYLAHIVPVDEIYFELRVIKDIGSGYEEE